MTEMRVASNTPTIVYLHHSEYTRSNYHPWTRLQSWKAIPVS